MDEIIHISEYIIMILSRNYVFDNVHLHIFQSKLCLGADVITFKPVIKHVPERLNTILNVRNYMSRRTHNCYGVTLPAHFSATELYCSYVERWAISWNNH